MNKLELISALKTEANISKAEAAKVVQIFFDNMADAMASTANFLRAKGWRSGAGLDCRTGTGNPSGGYHLRFQL